MTARTRPSPRLSPDFNPDFNPDFSPDFGPRRDQGHRPLRATCALVAGLVLASTFAVSVASAAPPASKPARPPAAAPAPKDKAPDQTAPTEAQVQAILTSYLALGAALVAGDAPWAGKHAAALATAAAPVTELAKTLLAWPTDLAGQRKRFSAVSDATIALAARFPKAAEGLNVVYCSMAPGRWLQRGRNVKNPYYGTEMLACGQVEGPVQSTKAGAR